jgi:hypothetical protein
VRKALENINGRRIKVFAEVSKFGKKSAYRGYDLDTVCLINLKDENNNDLCDHLWLIVRKTINRMNLCVGDKISFLARVKEYEKGYKGYRDDVYNQIETDYKLSNATQFVKLENPEIADNISKSGLFTNLNYE